MYYRVLSALFVTLFTLSLGIASVQAAQCEMNMKETVSVEIDMDMADEPCHEMVQMKEKADSSFSDCCDGACNFCYVAQTAALSLDNAFLGMPSPSKEKSDLKQAFKTIKTQPPHDPPQVNS
tara:strand:+ start:435 stop:800 length:366 start_codon:yes stop_codon:yes gene_type:complete